MAEEALNQEHEQQDVDTQDTEAEPSFALPSILADEESDDGSSEPESGDDSKDESDDEQEQVADGDQQQEEEGEKVASLTDLIESQEWDQEWFNGLKVPIKVNGQPAEATFQDLVNSYQTQEAATQRLDEAKSKAQQLHQEATQKLDESTTELATASAMVKLVEETVFKQDLEELERLKSEHGAGSDEYQAARETLSNRYHALTKAKQDIAQKLKESIEQRSSGPSDEDYAEAQAKLFDLHPELKDEGNRAKLVQFALDLGFTTEQLSAETNPLLFSLAWRALQHDETKAKANAAEKKVKKVPKMLKPGAQQPAKPKPRDHAEVLYGTK